MAIAKRRDSKGSGQFVSRSQAKAQAPGPQDDPPAWTHIQRGETPEAWITRIKQPWMQYQLDSGFSGDLVGLKRHELLGKHAFPVKSELDVTGRQDEAWLQKLTDQELDVLDALKRTALDRTTPQVLGITSTTVLAPDVMSSNPDTTCSSVPIEQETQDEH